MEIGFKNMSQLLDESLTLVERGLLVTILLLRDNDPKLTLAKVKAKVRVNEVKKELVNLNEKGYIKWSGYKQAVKSLEEQGLNPQVLEVVTFMNNLYKTKFDPSSKSTTVNLINRLQEHSVEDVKKVVANRYSVWKEDPVMNVHLNPTTIFRPSKFDKYLEEVNRTQEGERFLQAVKTDLKGGDEITFDIAMKLVDSEVYILQVYNLDREGKRFGNGTESIKYGKDIKRALTIRENTIKHEQFKEFEYIYKPK